ncbi:MAG: sigma 54-interacting transcriptional regulator [Acidobacteriia bacterium]|nr:sigma 54-interacting transcriptional regulator [Terriglobia bacterium]
MSSPSAAGAGAPTSQPSFETVFAALPGAVIVTDHAGRICQVNAQAERLFGYARNELLGQPVEILIFEDAPEAPSAPREDDIAAPPMRCIGADGNMRGRRKGGSVFPVEVQLAPLESPAGHFLVAAIRDLSEARQIDVALRESESLLRQLTDHINEIFFVSDMASGKVLYVSPAYETVWGRSCQSLYESPMSWFEAIHPDDRKKIAPAVEKFLVDGEFKAEYRVLRPDGTIRWIFDRAFPVRGPSGEVQRTVGIAEDITESKQAKEAYRLSEERFHLLVDSARDYAIFMLDPGGFVGSWNAGAERLTGFEAPEILGKHFSCFYIPEDVTRGKPEQTLRAAAAQGRFEDQGWRIRKDGSRFWASAITSAIRDESGQLLGFARVSRDITEHKKAEEALLLELSNALLANRNIHQLLGAISASIEQVVPHDYATLALFDPETSLLRVQLLDAWNREESHPAETTLPVEGSAAGHAFTTREPFCLGRLDTERFDARAFRHLTVAGIKSGCWLPLIGRDRALGTLMVGSRREDAFTQKDCDMLEQIAGQVALAVDNVLAFRQIAELSDKLIHHKQYLEDEFNLENSFEDVIGESTSLKRVLKQIETVAPTDATVLILGETGTGKELIARAIHRLSSRSEQTFVRLSCAAIPAGLLESELFGHEKGAFTGAIAQKIGRLELAHKGTLFLDEIGDLPLELQPKILRALQEKEFERIGSTRTIPVNFRLVAATNRDLAKMVAAGQFRSDLYYRLRVFPITAPPLRERREDIPLLVRYFVDKYSRRMDRHIDTIPPEALQVLSRWDWPGNVRELENFIERAVILTTGPVLRVPLAEIDLPAQPEPPANLTLEAAEREHILRVLRETQGVIGGPKGAAVRLDMKRTTLNSKLKKLRIEREDYI